jgi:hypothetical protein
MELLFVEGRLQCTQCRGVHKKVSCVRAGMSWAVQEQDMEAELPQRFP